MWTLELSDGIERKLIKYASVYYMVFLEIFDFRSETTLQHLQWDTTAQEHKHFNTHVHQENCGDRACMRANVHPGLMGSPPTVL